jgi:hypothetical protein
MPLLIRRLNRTYTVGRDPVVLRTIVGDGQFGSSVVALDGVEIASGAIAMLQIGPGKDVKGKTLSVKTTVTDVMRSSNHTSMTYELSGGPSTDTHPAEAEVRKDGDSVLYLARFSLQ